MTSDITLACIVVAPIAIIYFLRANATFVFFSLCLGDVLAQFIATDTNSLTNLLSASHLNASLQPPGDNWRLFFILLPVVITLGLTFHTVKGQSKKILNIFPAIGVGLVGALLVVPVLPSSIAQSAIDNSLWSQLTNYQGIVVALSALACLSMVWLQRPKSSGGKKSKYAA